MNNYSTKKFSLSPKKLELLQKLSRQAGLDSQFLPVISHRDRSMSVPLSYAQQRLWFLEQMEADRSPYSELLAMRLTGTLNTTALELGFKEIIRRHEILRTTFSNENEKPVQKISPDAMFSLRQTDITTGADEQKLSEVIRAVRNEPFDLSSGPLLRVLLVRTGKNEHVLLLSMHHIIFDRWSTGVLFRELSILYNAFSEGGPSPLPELTVQYADFTVWQRAWLSDERLEKELTFWTGELKGMTGLELPVDHPRPKVQTFRGNRHGFKLSRELTESLKGLSQRENVTLFMTVFAAFQCLLHRHSGQDDIVVGSPIANRNRAEIEGLIGFFVNTLVIRTDVSDNPVFRELLKKVKKKLLGVYAHQDLPFEKLVEALKPERDMGRTPLFQVIFAMQNVPFTALDLTGLTLDNIEIEDISAKFDLEVYLHESTDGFSGSFIYNTDLFEAETIERMAGHFQTLLAGIAENPDQPLSELPILTQHEQYQLLAEWNDTYTDYPRGKCIHGLFEFQAERMPDAIAVCSGSELITYRDLNESANQLAHYLRRLGVGPEVFVGICVERSLEMVTGILGILKAGAAYVPLDPEYPKERLSFMIKDTGIKIILAQQRMIDMIPEQGAGIICLDSDMEIIKGESRENPDTGSMPGNPAYVMYTSGSTGAPKGVSVSHRAVMRLTVNTNYVKIGPTDVIGQASIFSFDAATFEIWGALLNGARLAIIPKVLLLSPGDFAEMIRKMDINILFITTAVFNQMAREEPGAFRSLRYLLFGGEAVDVGSVRRILAAGAPGRLLHVYGPTESTTFASWYHVKNLPETARTIPIGKPVSNTTIYLLDRHLQPVPAGITGELFIGGEGVAREYLNRPELTSEKFISDPFSKKPGARLYKTGDLARYLPDGNIEFIGRIDHQVKIRGYRIEAGEIEAVLGQCPGVREAVVVAREDHPGDKRLVSYLVIDEKSGLTRAHLRRFLTERLPGYMVPSVFVMLNSLPLTPNRKVDRNALPAPDRQLPYQEKRYEGPRNSLEEQLTRAWEKVLGIHPVGTTDNFFAIGGHSLLVVGLVAEMKKVTGKSISVNEVFKFPTITQLAVAINLEEGCDEEWTLMTLQPYGTKPPLFWAHGGESQALLPKYLGPDQPVYGLTHQGQDGGPISHRTFEAIASHHIREIRRVQPEGPYLLGAHCIGATLVFEIAQQLIKQGEKVPFLFFVEPTMRLLPSHTAFYQSSTEDYSFKKRLAHHYKTYSLLTERDRKPYLFRIARSGVMWPKQKIASWSRKKAAVVNEKIKLAVCSLCLSINRPIPQGLRRFYRNNTYIVASNQYNAEVYPGKLVIVGTDKNFSGTQKEWGRIAEGGADLHQIEGADHISILSEPFISSWANIFAQYINELPSVKVEK